ncbi:MAG: IS4 family transposase [Bacteroidetes bacterium]|nr:IS4 family transposase [Bacteroidota bacterium]
MNKSSFFTGQPVFTQLLNLIPLSIVNRLSRKHGSNRYCKRFMSYDHLVSMLYAGFFQCTSLREQTTGMQANCTRLQHLGLKHTPRRSTLSDANKRRSASLFEDIYHELYHKYFSSDSRLKKMADRLFIIDSTTISLFTEVMKGAGDKKANGRKKGGVKAHMMVDACHDIPAFIHITEGKAHDLCLLQKLQVPDNSTLVMDKAYINHKQFNEWNGRGIKWITRLKTDANFQIVVSNPLSAVSLDMGVREDAVIILGRPSNRVKTPLVTARLIKYYDQQNNRHLCFITNNMQGEPEMVAGIYKRRWQIELLFKRIKQRYPLKYFLGDNPNAIKIQIWAAVLCDLLVRVIQQGVNRIRKRPWSYASLASMIKHHLMTYINLTAFLINPEKALINYKTPDLQKSLFT